MKLVIKSDHGYFCQTGRYGADLYWTRDCNNPHILVFDNEERLELCKKQTEFREFIKNKNLKIMTMPVTLQNRIVDMADDEWNIEEIDPHRYGYKFYFCDGKAWVAGNGLKSRIIKFEPGAYNLKPLYDLMEDLMHC